VNVFSPVFPGFESLGGDCETARKTVYFRFRISSPAPTGAVCFFPAFVARKQLAFEADKSTADGASSAASDNFETYRPAPPQAALVAPFRLDKGR
jgi:hypothetical protein